MIIPTPFADNAPAFSAIPENPNAVLGCRPLSRNLTTGLLLYGREGTTNPIPPIDPQISVFRGPKASMRRCHCEITLQLTAFFTSAPILASSAAVNCVRAKAVGHMVPSSMFALSLKPSVAYLVLNFCAL
jgi:hypothetical protein